MDGIVSSGWGVVVVFITAMQTAARQVVFSSRERWEGEEQHRHNPVFPLSLASPTDD
jgi:hypothetical protein